MTIVLCKKIGLNVKKLLKRFNNIIVVNDCYEKLKVDGIKKLLLTCPALYHKNRDQIENFEILDLRVLNAFKNPTDVAESILISEIEKSGEVEIETIKIGDKVLYVGNNLDLIYDLSPYCNLTVVTQDNRTIENLYPYDVRVINGYVKDIEGSVGKFKVKVDGVDVTSNETVNEIIVDQIIYPGFNTDKKIEGLYTDEYTGAFKVLVNINGYLKPKVVSINYNTCGFLRSGYIGCTYCLKCPEDAIIVKNGKLQVSNLSCTGCGFCSSICFTSSIKNNVLPDKLLINKIKKIKNLNKYDVLVFACRNSLGKLRNLKNLPTIGIILVPCINSISEVHYLYAVASGFRVLVVPCDCKDLILDMLTLAKVTLELFGFDCISLSDWDKLKTDVPKLKKRSIPKISANLIENSLNKNKRYAWYKVLEDLMNTYGTPKVPALKGKYFGKIKIKESCTLCNACINSCRTEAIIKKKNNKIEFIHALCIGCGLCAEICPENAIEIEKTLDLNEIGKKTLFEDEMIVCPRCKKPHMSKRAYEKLKTLTGLERTLLFCEDCRPVVILESLYEEVVNELNELKRRRLGEQQ